MPDQGTDVASSVFISINMYLIDSFTTYAASALAGSLVVRSIGGALVPMSGLRIYYALGMGWGNSVLGFVTAALIPVPFIMLKWGEKLRKRFEIRGLYSAFADQIGWDCGLW
jgi:hypothetical protein